MATLKENLQTALDRYAAELAAGPIKPDYSINGQSVDWVDYRKFLLDEITRLTELVDSLGEDDGGIVTELTQTWT